MIRRGMLKGMHWLSQISLVPPPPGSLARPRQGPTAAEMAATRKAAATQLEMLSEQPLVFISKGFLSLEECAAVIKGSRKDGIPMKGSSGPHARDTKYELDMWPTTTTATATATPAATPAAGGAAAATANDPATGGCGAAIPVCHNTVLESAYARLDALFNFARQHDEVCPKVHFSAPPNTIPPHLRPTPSKSTGGSGCDDGLPGMGSSTRMPLGLHVDTNAVGTYATAILYLSTLAQPTEDGATVFPCATPTSATPGAAPSAAVAAAQALLKEHVLHTEHTHGDPNTERHANVLLDAAECRQNGLSIYPEAGKLVIFFTRGDDGLVDPFSWHGGAAVGAVGEAGGGCGTALTNDDSDSDSDSDDAGKWMMQLCKEIPVPLRAEVAQASFVAARRRDVIAAAAAAAVAAAAANVQI